MIPSTLDELKILAEEALSSLQALLKKSAITERHPQHGSDFIVISPYPWAWAPLKTEDQLLVGEARKRLQFWSEMGRRAIRSGAPERENDFTREGEVLQSVVDRATDSKGPSASSIEQVSALIERAFQAQINILTNLPSAQSSPEVIFIPDTNALLSDPRLERWDFHESPCILILVPQVIRELDKLKMDRKFNEVGEKADKLIRRFKEYGRRGDTFQGVKIVPGITFREVPIEADMDKTLSWLRAEHGDDQILATVLELRWENLNSSVTLVTHDRNLANKARLARIRTIDSSDFLSNDSEVDDKMSTDQGPRFSPRAKGSDTSGIEKTEAISPPNAQVQAVWDFKWLEEHRSKATYGLQNIQKAPRPGFMEVGFTLGPPQLQKTQKELLEATQKAQIETFGWPIGVVLGNREEYRPRPRVDGIVTEVAISEHDRRSYDYWACRCNGDFYLLMSLFEDMRQSGKIFFNTRIVRITETLMYCARLYSELGVPSSTIVHIFVTHGGLKDRMLTAVGGRALHFDYKTTEDQVDATVSVALGDIQTQMVELVKVLASPLFMIFDFFAPADGVYHDIVNQFVAGRCT